MIGGLSLRLPPGSRLEEPYPRQYKLSLPRGALLLSEPSEEMLRLVEALLTGGVDASEEGEELAALRPELVERGGLSLAVHSNGEPFATAVARTGGFEPKAAGGSREDDRFVLSRFATLHRGESGLVLVSPRSRVKLLSHDPRAAALFHRLSVPCTLDELVASVAESGPSARTVAATVALARGADLLTAVDAEGRPEEDGVAALRQWEAHDLAFHARSRSGRHGSRVGATYRLEGELEPLPARHARDAAEHVELARPDLERLRSRDRTLTDVIETRRSVRRQGSEPIALDALGELLYRTARSRGVRAGERHEIGDRPYPGGGGAYELEIYLAVDRCRGLDAGLYHYEAGAHRLARLAGRSAALDRLVESAGRTAHDMGRPQVVVVLAARFRRLFWKYSSIGYATILKDVGALMHNFYLVATAMELGVCALGGGDSDLFAELAATDYYEETSVGELILGSLPEEEDR